VQIISDLFIYVLVNLVLNVASAHPPNLLLLPSSSRLIVQLPLPAHINEKAVLEQVGLAKDADGFDPLNIGIAPPPTLQTRGGEA
jgi:hypothetical protein